mmetsp:Transcript_67400/g.185749  ORF Transcript_67400/g.185749 Transcript_67400/m.185749 type:complete len:319 (-) Transcript_67400:2606-3562(-)
MVSVLNEYEQCGDSGIFEDGGCTCFDCFRGTLCNEELLPEVCVVNAAGGTPLIFEDYWVQHPDEATITIRPAYHIGYGKEIGCGNVAVLAGSYRVAGMNPACDELAAVVRRIHTMVGNANFGNDDNGDNETMYLVFGVGSTELIAASMWALADEDADEPSLVWSRRPYYAGYEGPASYFDSKSPRFEWFDSETPPDATSRRIIELVTSPNNPDGSMRSPVVSGENGRAVFDSAYYWPHFTPIEGAPRTTELREHDVALFTLSKLTGHAGTRIGWAVTRDETVATRIAAFVKNAGELPRENQLRGLAVLTVLANQVLFR